MRKNYNGNNQQNLKDVEERVQVTQETCNCEEELEAAIERSKQKLKSSAAPSGYTKIDEKVTTRIYRIPDNKYVNENNIIEEEEYAVNRNLGSVGYDYQDNQYETSKSYNNNIYNTDYKKNKYSSDRNYFNSNNYNNTDYYNKNANFKLEYVSSVNPRKMKYVENYENNYNYNNRTPKTFTKYEPYTQGRIENYYENNISKDGQYLVTISLSKIVNDPAPKSYHEGNNYNSKKETTESNKKNYNYNYKKEIEITEQNKNNYNYKKEKIEPNKNNYNFKKEKIELNKNNYNYKKEKIEPNKNNYDFKKDKIDLNRNNYKNNKEKIVSNKNNDKSKSNKVEKETYVKTETNAEKYGHNYNFYERKENVSTSKAAEFHQRIREPYRVQKEQKSVKTPKTTYNNYNSNQPGKNYQTVVKSYKK